MLAAGETMKEVVINHPAAFVKFNKGFQAFQAILLEPRNTQPEVIVMYGGTGVGKSKMAREITDQPYIWYPHYGQWRDLMTKYSHNLC